MKDLFWFAVALAILAYVVHSPDVAQFFSLFRAVGPGFGW